MSANNVIIQVLGGSKIVSDDCSTVADARAKAGVSSQYQATVNDAEASDSYQLDDGDFVTFTEKVKGGEA
jgi:hypothetical protein